MFCARVCVFFYILIHFILLFFHATACTTNSELKFNSFTVYCYRVNFRNELSTQLDFIISYSTLYEYFNWKENKEKITITHFRQWNDNKTERKYTSIECFIRMCWIYLTCFWFSLVEWIGFYESVTDRQTDTLIHTPDLYLLRLKRKSLHVLILYFADWPFKFLGEFVEFHRAARSGMKPL